jgi:hypothetical protein
MSQPTDKQTAPVHRVLHVLLPEEVFNHVKAQAALSGLAFKEYLERFLREATPYDGKASPVNDTPRRSLDPAVNERVEH